MNNIIMLGPPGSGKGTQAGLLAAHFNIVHVSFGDVLRKHIDEETEIGRAVKSIIYAGRLVGIDIMSEILMDVLDNKATSGGVILDGFPRNIEQAQLLEKVLKEKGKTIAAIVNLVVSDDKVRERIAHRASVENRLDDQSSEKIAHRLDVYKNETTLVKDFYNSKIDIFQINAENTIDGVFEDIVAAFKRK